MSSEGKSQFSRYRYRSEYEWWFRLDGRGSVRGFSRCGGAARCPVAAARVSASADWPLARAARPCRGRSERSSLKEPIVVKPDLENQERLHFDYK